jgi:hypothetical protein
VWGWEAGDLLWLFTAREVTDRQNSIPLLYVGGGGGCQYSVVQLQCVQVNVNGNVMLQGCVYLKLDIEIFGCIQLANGVFLRDEIISHETDDYW